MSTHKQWFDADAEAKRLNTVAVVMPPALKPKEWIAIDRLPDPSWNVVCAVTKNFEWFGQLLWNEGAWEEESWSKRNDIAHVSEITHYHWFGIGGETKPKKVILIPMSMFFDKPIKGE